jgi:hypothetical protein
MWLRIYRSTRDVILQFDQEMPLQEVVVLSVSLFEDSFIVSSIRLFKPGNRAEHSRRRSVRLRVASLRR